VQGAARGNAASIKVYRREVQLLQLTLTTAKFLTKTPSHLAGGRKSLLLALAQQIVSPTAASGRRLQATTIGALG